MERPNFFEILDLSIDPIEKDSKIIKEAIEDWKKKLEELRSVSSDQTERQFIRHQLSFHDEMKKLIGDTSFRETEANSLKEIRIRQLEALLDIMLASQQGDRKVTNAQIKNIKDKLKLSVPTIRSIYKNKGYEIMTFKKNNKLGDIFLNDIKANELSQGISNLQAINSPYYPWASKVKDLYDLMYYYSEEPGNLDSFKKKKTTDLYNMLDSWSVEYASDMSTEGRILSGLFSIGRSYVFDSEENRKKYNQTLELEKLTDLFALLHSAPEAFKKDRYFADICIKIIQKSFPDYYLALALYNKEAGLNQDPYEPFEPLIYVTCNSCKTPAEFRSKEEAENGKCAVCGSALYTICPKCQKKVPAIADRCSCGFMISEMHFFDEYIKEAEYFLKEFNLVEAEKQFIKAKNAHPGHQKLIALSKKLHSLQRQFDKPINEINTLISAGKYSTAQTLLKNLMVTMPKLKLNKQKKIIDDKMTEVKRMMPADSNSAVAKANRCVEILQIVEDYQPAIDILNATKPRKPLNLTATVKGTSSLTCTLSWTATGDKGIRYYIVRKENGLPKNIADGQLLSRDREVLYFEDKGLQPGKNYGYAVFASRYKVFSDPATREVTNLADLDMSHLQVNADNGICSFSWVLPSNCIGVRILRSTNTIPTIRPSAGTLVVTEKAIAGFEDLDVSNNTTYGYRLQCIYPGQTHLKYSQGVTVSLTPEHPPKALRNVTSQIKGSLVTIKWELSDNIQRNVEIREVPSNIGRELIGQILPLSNMYSFIGKGKKYSTATSTDMQAQFTIPAYKSLNLAVISKAGTKGIISDFVQVSSVEKCEIDKLKTQVKGNQLVIILAKKPKNLKEIHYQVATKSGIRAPWATSDDASKKLLSIVSVSKYDSDGLILVNRIPQDTLYISIIGQYELSDGSIVYSEPSKFRISNSPKKEIEYWFEWIHEGSFFKKKKLRCKLHVHSKATLTPEIYVVYHKEGRVPIKLDDPYLDKLHIIPETDSGFPNGEYIHEFPETVLEKLVTGTPLRLLIQKDDMIEFILDFKNIENCKVPKRK